MPDPVTLPGKAFGYPQRVRVTPGLQRRFARLDPGFTYRQWPGFSPRTHPYGLAGTYVFIKQSGPPCHCDLRFQSSDQNRRHPFSRSYGANLPSSLTRGNPDTPWASHPGHLCRFSVRSRGLLPSSLFTGPRDRANPPLNGRPIPPSAGSRHYGTPRPSAVGWSGNPTRPTPRRQELGLRCRKRTPAAREY